MAAWLGQSAHDLADARLARDNGRHALADLCEDALALDSSFDLIKTVAVLLDKHFLGARYPTALPGGVPAEAYESRDAERALEVAEDVRRFVLERLDALGL